MSCHTNDHKLSFNIQHSDLLHITMSTDKQLEQHVHTLLNILTFLARSTLQMYLQVF